MKGHFGMREPKTKAETPLAAAIRAVRLDLHLTVEEFAERIGTNHSAVCRWESAKMRPNFVQLLKVGESARRPLRDVIVEELRKMVRRESALAMLAEIAGGAV